jgi:hypothetical protein
MTFFRTLTVPTPQPASGANWIARALLEAPAADGPWTPIQATTSIDGPITSNLAECETGYYRVQWHDDKQTSRFSEPVLMTGHIAEATGGQHHAGRR